MVPQADISQYVFSHLNPYRYLSFVFYLLTAFLVFGKNTTKKAKNSLSKISTVRWFVSLFMTVFSGAIAGFLVDICFFVFNRPY
jgi:hypothetical protein